MKTAKFWFYWNDTKTLLKLRDDEELTLYKFTRWDEGYHHQWITFIRQQGRLIMAEKSISRDCDGRFEDYRVFHALIGTCPHPNWRRVEEIYTDHTAIAADY